MLSIADAKHAHVQMGARDCVICVSNTHYTAGVLGVEPAGPELCDVHLDRLVHGVGVTALGAYPVRGAINSIVTLPRRLVSELDSGASR